MQKKIQVDLFITKQFLKAYMKSLDIMEIEILTGSFDFFSVAIMIYKEFSSCFYLKIDVRAKRKTKSFICGR